MLSVARKFVVHVVPGVLKPLRILWNEMIGFIFLVIGLWPLPRIYREAREFDGETGDFARLIMLGFFALVMCGFALFSFLRAKKISRS